MTGSSEGQFHVAAPWLIGSHASLAERQRLAVGSDAEAALTTR